MEKLSKVYKEKVESEKKKKLSDKNEKYLKYIINLQQYKDIKELEPVFSFYNKPQEVAKALEAYEQLPKKEQGGNMTFMVGSVRLVSLEIVQGAIKLVQRRERAVAHRSRQRHGRVPYRVLR